MSEATLWIEKMAELVIIASEDWDSRNSQTEKKPKQTQQKRLLTKGL